MIIRIGYNQKGDVVAVVRRYADHTDHLFRVRYSLFRHRARIKYKGQIHHTEVTARIHRYGAVSIQEIDTSKPTGQLKCELSRDPLRRLFY